MKTKEEILIGDRSTWKLHCQTHGVPWQDALNAMEQYAQQVAKQQAIAFNQHVLGKLKVDKSTWAGQENDEYIMSVHANPDNHYAQFIESQNKGQ